MRTKFARHRGMRGLGDIDSLELEQYYFSLKDRSVEAAQKTLDVADQWAELQQLKNNTINGMVRAFGGAVPKPSGSIFELLGWVAEVGAIYSRNFAPALAEVSRMFEGPEARLKEAAAVAIYLNSNFQRLGLTVLDQAAVELKASDYVDDTAQQVIQRAGAAATLALKPHQWALKALAESTAYMSRVAPDLRSYTSTTEGQEFGMRKINEILDRPALMSKLGISAVDLDQALKSVGLGIEPITITIIVVLAIIAAGSLTYIAFAHKAAREAAGVAKAGVDGLTARHERDMQALAQTADAITKRVAAESDPARRATLASEGKTVLEAQVRESVGGFEAEAKIVKKKIDDVANPGFGFDFSALLVPLGVAAGGLLVLKGLKII